ncbi:Thiosulfate sulfurtransferase GlpE [subsurface metagenome]
MSPKKLIVPGLSVLLVIGAALAGGCAGAEIETPPPAPPTPTQIIENVTPQEAFALIQDNQGNPDFVIIDVRTPEEFAEAHIENAINIDFYAQTFRDELDRLDKNKTYLIYCRSGNRSGNALDIMTELNFREVYHISDGITKWQAAGLPVVK